MRGFLTTLAASLLLTGCPTSPPPPVATATVRGKTYVLELVATRQARKKFLLGRTALAPDRGILVLHARPVYQHYEPQATYGGYDVAFIDGKGAVVETQAFDPNHSEGITSEVEARFALFLPPGAGPAKGDAVVFNETAARSLPEEAVKLRVGGHPAWVEIASTGEEQKHGLMFRPRMSADDGMLFVYAGEGNRNFWMKNTWIPLDIAFFAADGSFLNVVSMATYPDPANPPQPYPTADSKKPARYVLEMNRGWFAAKGLTDAAGEAVAPFTLVVPSDDLK